MKVACKVTSQACRYKSTSIPTTSRITQLLNLGNHTRRTFSCVSIHRIEGRDVKRSKESGVTDDELRQRQVQTPWHREGSDISPAEKIQGKGTMLKGKLLTTPSRLLKLTLPLTTFDHNCKFLPEYDFRGDNHAASSQIHIRYTYCIL